MMAKDSARRTFWESWTECAVQTGDYLAFMLGEKDHTAATRINVSDIKEIFTDFLPDITGLTILELASGSGRLTGELAKRCKHVTSTDFISDLVKENKRTNGSKYDNITFNTLDATKMDYPPNSFDMIFFTFLLVYLTDEEIETFVQKVIRMLRPGGYLFFRESHFKCICSRSSEGNPGIYRSLKEYYRFFRNCQLIDNSTYLLDIIHCTNSRTYVTLRNIPTVFNYLWMKTGMTVAKIPNNYSQKLLDDLLHSVEHVKAYNSVIGDGFCVPGGLTATKEKLAKLDFSTPNHLCLDVGCGLGGIMKFLITEFGINVTGLDYSMHASQETAIMLQELQMSKGFLKTADVSIAKFELQSYDTILMLETIQYIKDKETILSKLKKWLKPIGQILISTYCYGNEVNVDVGLKLFLESNNLFITTENEFHCLLQKTYSKVIVEDYTTKQIEHLRNALDKITTEKNFLPPVASL